MQTLRFILIVMILSGSFNSLSQKKEIVVVIDPGHGGHDPGHLSNSAAHLEEKNLNLKIAQFLGGYIEKYLQNVRVVYTRVSDVYPSLDDRVGKANTIGADYFISIHCNGNDRRTVHGTESHVHTFDLKKSVHLANNIEHQFSKRAGRKSRGVKDQQDLQHSLQVLKYTNMPSVLVECGFITNEREANFLNSDYGQEIIASAIFRGFRTTIQEEFPQIAFVRTTPSSTQQTLASDGQSFAIQIASSKAPINTDDYNFKKLKMSVERRELNTSSAYRYIYIVGDYGSKKEAKDQLAYVQQKGFRDAIVVRR